MELFNLPKTVVKKILGFSYRFYEIASQIETISKKIDEAKILTGKSLINQIKSQGIYDDIQHTEFKVFSQFGDDGIIQYLINNVEIENKIFIEFGVENYVESNTRFLLINNNWKGLVIDGSQKNIDYIKKDEIYWKHDLTAVNAFIDRDNINEIILKSGLTGRIGILSIDIDGNDYWIWEAINVVDPVIVIVEYNSVFGGKNAVTIPYQPDFYRTKSHYSNLYWGCSLKALCLLAEKKGYVFVGSISVGNNAYFVRQDKLGKMKPLSFESGYVQSKYRESRDPEGRLTYISGDERLKVIEDMPVYDVETDVVIPIKELTS